MNDTYAKNKSRRNRKPHTIISGVIILVSIIGEIWFLLPVFTHRIINIGNLTGGAVGILLFLYGIAREQFHAFCQKLWKTKAGRVLLLFAATVVGVIVLIWLLATGAMWRAAADEPSQEATVIVLGCRVYGERPSLMLTERMDAAYDYLTAHPKAKCILSGGKGSDEAISEAECMYRYLTDKGIEEERLYIEDTSTSTRENLAFSKEIIETENLSEDVALVTNEFHEYRARKIGEKAGLHTSAVPARTAWWLFPTYYVRELYGIVYEWIL